MVYELIRVTDVGHRSEKGEVIVWLTGRAESGKRVHKEIEGTLPYAFIPKDYDVPDESYIVSVDDVSPDSTHYEGYDGMPLRKITVKLPKHINNRGSDPCLTDHIPKEFLYEGDIPYDRRVGVDYGLSGYIRAPKGDRVHISDIETQIDPSDVPNIEPRVMMCDIEAHPPNLSGNREFQDFVDEASQPITAITTYDSYTEEYLAVVLDREDLVNPGEIRGYLEDHWEDHELAEEYTQADMRLVQCENEESVLTTFIKEVEDKRPDVISGWNWIDFDHEYIINRLKRDEFSDITEHRLSDIGTVGGYKTAQMIDGLPGFDMMGAYCDKMTFSNWRSKSLDYVSNEVLEIGKVEDMNIGQEYKSNRSRFLAYNIIDTQLLVAMDERNGIHEFFYQLADLSSVQIYDTFSEMRLMDGFILARREPDEILPSAEDKQLGTIAGGLVLTPSNGVNEWVAVLDLKSLYPSIFITLNVSEETLTKVPGEANFHAPAMPESEDDVGGEITQSDISWDLDEDVAMGLKTDHEGILPKYLKLLFTERASFKSKRNSFDPDNPQYEVFDNKQAAVKVVMNAFYGASQNRYNRFSNPISGDDGVGSTITAGGRYVLWRGSEIMREMGYTVKYGDTDSVMIQLADTSEDVTPREVLERGMEVEEELNQKMDDVADEFGIGEKHPYLKDADLHGNDRHCLHWEFEKLYRRFLQAGTKKRYAGLPVWKEGKWYVDDPDDPDGSIEGVDPDITGFEAKRSDVPEIAAEVQEDVIKQVLGGAGFDEVGSYISNVVDDIENLNLPIHEIANPGVLNKDLKDYGNTPTARACRYSNRVFDHEWREGDDPWVYYIKSTPPMVDNTDVIALEWGEEIPEDFEVDTGKIIQKRIKKPLEPVLGETGWTFDELKTGRQMETPDTESIGNPFAGSGPVNNESTETTDTTEEGEQRPGEMDSGEDEDGVGDGDSNEEAADPLSW